MWHFDSVDYYVAFGPIKALLALPSGPPAYVFDSKGKMIDWSSDIGDDSHFSDKWKQRWQKDNIKDISLSDMDALFATTAKAQQGAAANP